MPIAFDSLAGGRILIMRNTGDILLSDAKRAFEKMREALRATRVEAILIDSSESGVKENPAFIRETAEDFFALIGGALPIAYVGPSVGWPIERAAVLKCCALEYDVEFDVFMDLDAAAAWLSRLIGDSRAA